MDLLLRLGQSTAARHDEPAHGSLRGREARVVPSRRGVEEHGQRGVAALARLLPDAEVGLGFLDRGAGGGDLLLGVGGAGDCGEGEGFAEFVGGPGELAYMCWAVLIAGRGTREVLGRGEDVQSMQRSSDRGDRMAL